MSVALFIAFVLILYLWIKHRKRTRLVPYMIEQNLRITHPVPLCGKPDVVWLSNGTLVVGDYKSRENQRIYPSEVIQLSVYKLLLEKVQAKPVAAYGFIHFKHGRKIKVNLLSEKKVVALYYHYLDIIEGRIKPCPTNNKNYCRCCSHHCRG